VGGPTDIGWLVVSLIAALLGAALGAAVVRRQSEADRDA
jgi:hypothetical protein